MNDSEKEDLLYTLLGGIVVFVACIIVVFATCLVKAAVMTAAAYMASGGSHILCMLALAAGIIAISAYLYRSNARKR